MGINNMNATTEALPRIESLGMFQIHPNFTVSNLRNNIAVINLFTPIFLGQFPHITNICVPNTPISNMRCFVAGWSRVNASVPTTEPFVMRQVDVPLVDGATCQTWLRATRLGRNFALDTNSFLCAGENNFEN
jgi:hypothetical protein